MFINRSYDPQQATVHLDRYYGKVLSRKPEKPLQIRIFSPQLGLDYCFPAGSSSQPYHIASIGKVFTAVLVQMLAEQELLSMAGLISPYFSAGELCGLFVYRDKDYAQQVTVGQILGHTSGIADYFEGKTTGGKSFQKDLVDHPNHHWTPEKLLDYTRENQRAVGSPGQVFHYSDSGYILLGLLIEKVTGKSFAKNLAETFFNPLGMQDSCLMFYSEPLNTTGKSLEKIWFNKVEISAFESLSCDWSGGGIVSTTADLLRFSLALRSGQLLQKSSLESMDICSHKFRQGIYYGLGMMEIRFQEFFFLLGRLPRVKGHIGILATHMFYDPTRDAHIMMNFGDNTRMQESFMALIEIENVLQRVQA